MDRLPEEMRLVRFGPFEANFTTGELHKHGIRLKLQGQPFQILKMLLSRPGELVTREQIRQNLWPSGTFVDFDNGLNAAVNKLREALSDSPENPRFIETLPRHGYRFIGGLDGADASSGHSPSEVQKDKAPRGPRKPRIWTLIAAASGVLVALATGGYFYFHSAPKLTNRDTIVLGEFANSTGDPVFDGTLRQGLSVQLEQSPFLSLVSEEGIQQALRLMGQPANVELTPQIAREVCQRTNSTTVLDGAIALIGTRYNLILRAVNCVNGNLLASTEAQASDKNHVLDALGRTASQIRSKLGESRSTLQKFSTPLEEATTTSLEALKAYSLGWKIMTGKGDYQAAVPFFRRAIRLDPNFAMAYAALGNALSSEENAAKAYELRERVSERERFYIEGHYLAFAGDIKKTRQVYELWALTYPRDWVPLNQLGIQYQIFGQFEKALELYRKAIYVEPNSLSYTNVVITLIDLNRFEEARLVAEEMRTKNLDSPGLHFLLFDLDFLQNDTAGMAKTVAWAAGKPEMQRELLMSESMMAAFSGKLKSYREFSRRAVELAEPAEQKETMAADEAEAALLEALVGNATEARTQAREALGLSTDLLSVQYPAALALALAGETSQSQKVADDLGKRWPNDSIMRFEHVPVIRSVIALGKGDASASIEALKGAALYETAIGLFPAYLRGVAYLAAHEGSEAAIEFQKVLDHRGLVRVSPNVALAHLGLARAYALQRDATKARAAYQDFLTLWKDADPDIPILKQAKAEYAKLQ